jgi:hypothetical protein
MTDEPLAAWREATSAIGPRGVERTRTASEAERADTTRALDLVALDRLEAVYRIRRLGDDRFALSGRLRAALAQSCVVSGDPVPAAIDEAFEVEYRANPGEEPAGTLEDEIEALAAPEIEPIAGGVLDVGRIVFETLAAALDPYPRAPGAELAQHESKPADATGGPFAELAKLQRKP